MKHDTEVKTIFTHIYSCERCGNEVMRAEIPLYKEFTTKCPKHGEYCYKCCNKEESKFPLTICPECKITCKEIIERCGIGAGGGLIKIDLPDPFIIIRDDSSGYWIGSKK